MITVIRRYFKHGSYVVLWIIVAAFIIGLMPMAFRQVTQASIWAVKVNGQEIGYQEFLWERERQREKIMAFKEQYGEYADWLLALMGATDPQSLAVRALIRQELLNQFADKLGIYTSNTYVEQKMSDLAFIRQELADIVPLQLVDPLGGIDQKLLGRYLKQMGISVELFERHIERVLIEKLMSEMVASTFYMPSFDVRQKMITQLAKRSFSIVTLPLDAFVRAEKQKEIAPATLAAFYQERTAKRGAYTVPEKRTGMAWIIDPSLYQIAVTDAQVKDYYENNKVKKYVESPAMVEVRRILIKIPSVAQRAAMQEKATHIKDEIMNNPTKFADIAKRVSEDSVSAAQGGLIKPFAKGSAEPALDRAAFLLQKDGDISDVIETSQGLEIVQRVSKTTQKFKPFDRVKQEIKSMLAQQAFQKQFTADMRRVGEDEAAFAALMKEKKATTKELKNIALDESAQAQHLFKLTAGHRTFFVDGDKGVALQLNTITDSYVPSLDSIRSTVLNDYYQEQAQQALKKTVQEARQALNKQSLKEVQKAFNGELTTTGFITAEDQARINALQKDGIPIERMLQMEKIGSVIAEQGTEKGFLVRLDEVEPLVTKDLDEKKAKIVESLQQERLAQYLEGFVASLYRNATIETNESVITLQV